METIKLPAIRVKFVEQEMFGDHDAHFLCCLLC